MSKIYMEINNVFYDISGRNYFSADWSENLIENGDIVSYFDTQERYFSECLSMLPKTSKINIEDSLIIITFGDLKTSIKAFFNINGLYRIEARKNGSKAFVQGYKLESFFNTKTGQIIKAKIKDYLIKKVIYL